MDIDLDDAGADIDSPLSAPSASRPLSSGSGGGGYPRKRKNQRHKPAAAPQVAPSLLLWALSLLADATGWLPLWAHPDTLRSLVECRCGGVRVYLSFIGVLIPL